MTDRVLNPEDLDRLGQAVISLTKELWVVKDRQRILEAALAEAGVLAPDTLDRYSPDGALSDVLRAERRQLIDSVLDTLATSSPDAVHR
jgi:hypothetical protein